MKSENKILSSYSCILIDKFMQRRDHERKFVITTEMLSKYIINILEPLCVLLKTYSNIYAIRALYRVIVLSKHEIYPYLPTLFEMLLIFLERVVLSPTESANATYNYVLFETLALLITKRTVISPCSFKLELFRKKPLIIKQ
jgi:hypothetical protein